MYIFIGVLVAGDKKMTVCSPKICLKITPKQSTQTVEMHVTATKFCAQQGAIAKEKYPI